MASLLYSQYIKRLEALQRFERKVTTPPFYMMLAIAFFLHLLFLAAWSLVPTKHYFEIPTNQINLRLSNGDEISREVDRFRADEHQKRVAEYQRKLAAAEAAAQRKRKAEAERKRRKELEAQKLAKQRLSERGNRRNKQKKPSYSDYNRSAGTTSVSNRSTRRAFPAPKLPSSWKKDNKRVNVFSVLDDDFAAGDASSSSPATVASPPAITSDGADSRARKIKEIEIRYTQQISKWIDKHKIYPAEAYKRGIEGRVMLHIRTDRAGNILRAEIEQSSGYPMLDNAVIMAARKANPLPPVPALYPGGHLLAFIITVNFTIND